MGREVAKFEKLQKAELGTRQKKQPGGREGAVSGRVQGFVVEGRGSRKLPRRERKILPDTVMIVLCTQLSCKSMVGWCLGRRRDEAAETESIENRKSVKARLDSAWSHPSWGSVYHWWSSGSVEWDWLICRVPSNPNYPEILLKPRFPHACRR